MGRGLERGMEDSLTELRGPWQVRGSRRVQHGPLVALLLPHLPRQRRGEPSGAVRRQPGPARRRRRGSRRRIPVLIWSWDSPGPAPAPGPRETEACSRAGGTARFGGWQRGGGRDT